MILRRAILVISAVAIVMAVMYALGQTQTSQTGTVIVSVSTYLGLEPKDTSATLQIDPASAPRFIYENVVFMVSQTTDDDLIYNMSGTNTNATLYVELSQVILPKSYVLTAKPKLLAALSISDNSASEQLAGPAIYLNTSFRVDLGNFKTASADTVDLPEGLLNVIYGASNDEKGWLGSAVYYLLNMSSYPHVALSAGGNFYMLKNFVCIVVVDPDLPSSGVLNIDGNEIVLIKPDDCRFDGDNSNQSSTIDLVSGADWAYPYAYSATAASTMPGLDDLYAANATDVRLLNITLTLPDGSNAKVYMLPSLISDSSKLLIFKPAYPVPYLYIARYYYANNLTPFAHIWPNVMMPWGAPASSDYRFTLNVVLEST